MCKALGIVDSVYSSEAMVVKRINELILFQSRRGLEIEDGMSLALKFLFVQAISLWYLLVAERMVL